MDALRAFGHNTFSSLKIRNYRLYFIGQGISHIGNWMQTVALGWLVLELTSSGMHLGATLAFRFAPILLLSPFVGLLIDSVNKRRLLYATQWVSAILALAMGVLVLTDVVQIWTLYLFAVAFGIVDSVDRPLRQIFMHEMVGPTQLRNAVTLGSTEANVARAIGPLIAGILIAGVGTAVCFLANALSFLGVIFFLTRLRSEEFYREVHAEHKPGGVLAGLRYAAGEPVIRHILIAMSVIGTLSYEFQVTLPLFAQQTYLGNAADYALLLAAMGVGSVLGGLFVASRHHVTVREFLTAAVYFGVAMSVTAIMPTLMLAIIGMIFVGFFSINLTSVGNTIVQLGSVSHLRGRVMALWTMALFGSTLIGAPTVGFVIEYAGARWGIALGGIAAILAAAYGAFALRRKDELIVVTEESDLVDDVVAAENVKI
ncbi:MAG: MFS transporter [Patescibacteria group bacterium]